MATKFGNVLFTYKQNSRNNSGFKINLIILNQTHNMFLLFHCLLKSFMTYIYGSILSRRSHKKKISFHNIHA